MIHFIVIKTKKRKIIDEVHSQILLRVLHDEILIIMENEIKMIKKKIIEVVLKQAHRIR